MLPVVAGCEAGSASASVNSTAADGQKAHCVPSPSAAARFELPVVHLPGGARGPAATDESLHVPFSLATEWNANCWNEAIVPKNSSEFPAFWAKSLEKLKAFQVKVSLV